MSWVSDLTDARKFLSKLAVALFLVVGLMLTAGAATSQAQSFTEGFDTITAGTPGPGWFAVNHSTTIGTVPIWFQGNAALTFPAHTGAATSYIGGNFNATTGADTINMWLLTPNRTFNNGDVVKFWTRCPNNNFPDRLQVRMSATGASTNVGVGPTGTGDFTTLLLDIDPDYEGIYPIIWTEFTLTISGLSGPTDGRIAFRYFVENGGPDGENSNYIGIDTFSYTVGSVLPQQHYEDYDGDGKTDPALVRNTGGGPGGQMTWFVKNTSGSPESTTRPWGINGDMFMPADYDGDNKTDIAVWRGAAPFESHFYILNSSNGTFSDFVFGQSGDSAEVAADYDGDGKDDAAVYRAGQGAGAQSSFWYRRSIDGGLREVLWGLNGDFPMWGDYDGDGLGDFVVQRNDGGGQARFYILFNTGTVDNSIRFGTPTDTICPGDYDGDGKTDLAAIRGSGGNIIWFIRPSSTGIASATPNYTFGDSATDFPVQGDWDGDGKTDIGLWRPNVDPTQNYFYWIGSTSGAAQFEWGQNGDYPPGNWNSH